MKRIFLILFCLIEVTANAQYCIDSRVLYNTDGLKISYCTHYLGMDGLCKKYEVELFIANSSNSKISMAGSAIVITNDVDGMFPAAGKCGYNDDVDIRFPGTTHLWNYSTEMNPGYSYSHKHIIHTDKALPYIEYNIVGYKKGVTDVWSDWTTPPMCSNIEYRKKKVELYNLAYQLHWHFEVRSKFNKPVSFLFDLLDKDGKKQFGDRHTLAPGEQTSFIHKMDGDYIKSIKINDIKYTDGRPVNCNGDDNNESNNKSFEDLVNRYTTLCQELGKYEGPTSAAYKRNCNLSGSWSYSPEKETLLKNKIKELEAALKTSGSSAAPGMAEINNEIKDLQLRQSVACGKLQQQGKPFNNRLCTEGYNGGLLQNEADAEKWVVQLRRQVKELESMISANEKLAEDEAERLKKESEARRAQFDKSMADGRTALGNNKYDQAISNFNTAKSFASSPQETAEANQAIAEAEKAKADAARKVRIEKKQSFEQQQTEAAAATTASVLGIMALIHDAYSPHWFAAKFQIGLGVDLMPVIYNSPSKEESRTYSAFGTAFHSGFKFGFSNNKGISVYLNPVASLTLNVGITGTSGDHYQYGGMAGILVSPAASSTLKLYGEYGWFKRGGNMDYDQDVASGGSTATDNVENANYKYSLFRMGGGLMLHWIDGSETYLKPGVYLDKISFAPSGSKPIVLWNLQANIDSEIILEVSYARRYAIGGALLFPDNLQKDSKDLWQFKIIRQGKLF